MSATAKVSELVTLLQSLPQDAEVYSIAQFTKKDELHTVGLNLEHPQKPHYKLIPENVPENEPAKVVLGQFATNVEEV